MKGWSRTWEAFLIKQRRPAWTKKRFQMISSSTNFPSNPTFFFIFSSLLWLLFLQEVGLVFNIIWISPLYRHSFLWDCICTHHLYLHKNLIHRTFRNSFLSQSSISGTSIRSTTNPSPSSSPILVLSFLSQSCSLTI